MTKENETMENRGNGGDTMGTYGRKGAKLHTKGFTLIASLLMLLLLSGIAIGLMMMVNTEGKVGATDLQSNLAYHAAEGGIEKMYSDLSAVFQAAQSPSATAICSVDNNPPTMVGVTWKDYSVTSQGLTCPASSTATVTANWGSVQSGPNAGLYAQIIPVNMLVTADLTTGGQEVSMTRQAQVALIPVFQFGMFCDGDCSIFPGSDMVFAGPVHANGDFYPFVNGGANLTFQSKVSVFGNIVRTLLPNTNAASIKKTGNVYVPTSNSTTACSITTPGNPPSTAAANNCVQLDAVNSATYGDGSVEGMGTGAAQPAATAGSGYYSAFNTWSNTTTQDQFINNNYYVTGVNTPPGTGANKLSLPFVNGTNFPYEIIRRPPAGESATSQLGQSREYNMAQIHVLLSDDPADLPGGAADKYNVRLANVTQTTGNTVVTPWGVTMAAGNYVPATFGTPAAGTYNLYFATASNSVPIPFNCTPLSVPPTCPSDDWSLPPVQWTAAMAAADGITYAAPVPANAPIYWNNGPAPTVNLCPPIGVIATSTPAPSLNCATSNVPTPTTSTPNTWPGTYPYYAMPNPSLPVETGALTTYNSTSSDSWGLIDGWLRVEYLNNSGQWVGVTNEWLALGFARGVTAPTAASPNPINPNAILLLQQPADRGINSTLATICTAAPCPAGSLTALSTGIASPPGPTTATAPVCTAWSGPHNTGNCTKWTPGVPPQLAADTFALAQPGTAATTGAAGDWAFGLTPAVPTATTPQSITMYNWYPINFYDAREGEPRDIDWSTVSGAGENSCTTNGVMNAVEIDVGNLQNWLNGTTPGSGQSVNSSAQNGYILYFSDRRGMLPNPNLTSSHPANTKSGDSGLEDTINSTSIVGIPDGAPETKMTGKAFSPEDDNQNGVLDNWGAYNLGLGFYGIVSDAATPGTTNLNTKINSTGPAKPNPYGTDAAGDANNRIKVCGRTGRKNWVSGARHVLKLVDGSLGQVPLMPAPVVYNSVSYWGGFTVASENPVYIQGDYNSSAADTTWATPPVDKIGQQAAAAVIADAVTLLSNNWDDRVSMVGLVGTTTSPTDITNRAASTTHYRLAIAAGKNMTFTNPAAWPETGAPDNEDDIGTDGGIHNFLHLLENWGNGSKEYYKGSLASLYYSTYNTGFYKCCTAVYGVPTRNFSFDLDFSVPAGLPPGTPMFRDVESLGYRQLFATRLANQ